MAIVNTPIRRPLTAGRARAASEPRAARSASYGFLGTGRLYDPCERTVGAEVTSVSCGDPVSKVAPGGMLVRWDEDGFPNWHAPGSNTKIGCRPATETVTAGRWCRTLGGSRTITVVIPRGASDNWYEMDACLRGPGIPSEQAEITAMLKTVHFTPGS
jgi:hypothetical protein